MNSMTPDSPVPAESGTDVFKIFALSGYAGAGKTTAAGMLQAISKGELAVRSFASPLKTTLFKMNPIVDAETGLRLQEALRLHGEQHVKAYFPEYRRLMQGMNSIKDFDTDFYGRLGAESVEALIAGDHFHGVIFDDMRFPSELRALERIDGAELTTIRLGLPATDEEGALDMHVTETALDAHNTDYIVVAETLNELQEELVHIYREVMNVA